MEMIFLGTSSGTPTKDRNVSGMSIKMTGSKSWHLVDCGEGTQHQILRTNLSLKKLDSIFITHVHGDHCYGLPGLLASAAMAGRTDALKIIAPQAIKEFIEVVAKSTELRLSYEVDFIEIESLSERFSTEDFLIDVIEVSHRVPSYAFSFIERNIDKKLNTEKLLEEGIESGPIWGKLQSGADVTLDDGEILHYEDYLLPGRKPRMVIVCGDNDNPYLVKEYAEQANVLVHEATYTEEVAQKVGKYPQHSSAKIVAQFAESIALKNLVLTHFSPRYSDGIDRVGGSLSEIEAEARKYFSGNLVLANDFDIFRMNREGTLYKSGS